MKEFLAIFSKKSIIIGHVLILSAVIPQVCSNLKQKVNPYPYATKCLWIAPSGLLSHQNMSAIFLRKCKIFFVSECSSVGRLNTMISSVTVKELRKILR